MSILNVSILIQRLHELHSFLEKTREQHKRLRDKTGQAILRTRSMVLGEQSNMSHRRMRIDSAFKQFTLKQDAMKDAQQKQQEYSIQYNQLRMEAGELSGQLDSCQQAINAAKDDAQQKLQKATIHYDTCRQEHTQARTDRDEAYQQVCRLEGIVSQLNSRLHSIESRIDSIFSAIQRCPPNQNPSGLYRQLQQAQHEAGETAAYLRKAQSDLASAENYFAQMRQKVDDCKRKEDDALSKKMMREMRMSKISQLHSQAMPLSQTRQYANQSLDNMNKLLKDSIQSLQTAVQYNQQGIDNQKTIEENFATGQNIVKKQQQMVEILERADLHKMPNFDNRDRVTSIINSTINTETQRLRNL